MGFEQLSDDRRPEALRITTLIEQAARDGLARRVSERAQAEASVHDISGKDPSQKANSTEFETMTQVAS